MKKGLSATGYLSGKSVENVVITYLVIFRDLCIIISFAQIDACADGHRMLRIGRKAHDKNSTVLPRLID